jgi:uncharacterized protein (TIGR03086 family)
MSGDPAATADPFADLDQAIAAFGQLTEGVRPDQLTLPTACTEFNVRALLGHVIGGTRLFAALLRDRPPPAPLENVPAADIAPVFSAAAADLRAAFAAPGVLERTFAAPVGELPGAALIQVRIVELLAHGWDLARATGQPTDGLPAAVAERALAFSRQLMPADRTGMRFAAEQPVSEGAPAVDRLAGFLGRPV